LLPEQALEGGLTTSESPAVPHPQ
ncbi:MAG: hypothetical protein RL148_522, partial [Planctomycetota bacterium]